MLKKVADNVYQLKIPIPYDLGSVNGYLIEGSNGYTIVDTGDYTEEAIALWEKVLPKNKPIEKVVLTHAHTDHIGLAGWFQKKYKADVWISRAGFTEIQNILSKFEGIVYSSPLSSLFYSNGGPSHPEQNDTFYNYAAYEFEPNYLFEADENDAIHILEDEGMTKYDTQYLMCFLEHLTLSYINSNVRLSNGTEGKIVMLNRHSLSRPVVKCGRKYIDLSTERNIFITEML